MTPIRGGDALLGNPLFDRVEPRILLRALRLRVQLPHFLDALETLMGLLHADTQSALVIDEVLSGLSFSLLEPTELLAQLSPPHVELVNQIATHGGRVDALARASTVRAKRRQCIVKIGMDARPRVSFETLGGPR